MIGSFFAFHLGIQFSFTPMKQAFSSQVSAFSKETYYFF